MEHFITRIETNLKGTVNTIELNTQMFTQDNYANRIIVDLYDGDDRVTVSPDSRVVGIAIRDDNYTLEFVGGLDEDGCPYIDLPRAAYDVVGPLNILIRLKQGNDLDSPKTVIAACRAMVRASITDEIIDPDHAIPSLDELLLMLEDMETARNNANTAASNANDKADIAQTKADLAQEKADLAQTKADLAQEKAELAQTKADLAQTKADIAQTAADHADASAANADEKADLAQEKAELAQTKADLAQTKADLAQTKADLAQEKADYAQAKGDYADQMATEASRVNVEMSKLDKVITVETTDRNNITTTATTQEPTLKVLKSGVTVTLRAEDADGVTEQSFTEAPIDDEAGEGDTQSIWSADKATRELALKLNTALKGANNGLAELDQNGKVPASQLPSYVDDVLEFDSKDISEWPEWEPGTLYHVGDHVKNTGTEVVGYICLVENSSNTIRSDEWKTAAPFPATGEAGKIYIAIDTGKTYRWGGSVYSVISETLALGETENTAYRGDRGKIAYDHAMARGSEYAEGLYVLATNAEGHVISARQANKADIGLDQVDNTADINKPASSEIRQIYSNIRNTYYPGIQGFMRNAEAWAVGERDGAAVPVTDETYQNNAKYYAEHSEQSDKNAEAWAVGQRRGVDVASDDPTYENNAKYYAGEARQDDENAEAWAVGQRGGVNVGTGDVTYENNARYYALLGVGSSQSAATSAANAAASESNAATSEFNAANSASAAAASETNAAASEANALSSEQHASTSESNAEAWAVGERHTIPVVEGDAAYQNNAKYYANRAGTSESNAATSETNAANSASAAAASESNAATSESNAANSASAAAASESNAATSEANAASSESNAATSETNAANSASAAATSESNAATSASNAEAWAVGKRDNVPVTEGDPTYQNNAKDYANQAKNARDAVFGMRAEATTLVPGSSATASYANGLLSLGIPRGDIGPHTFVTGTDVAYQNGSSGTTIPTGTWLDTAPETPQGEYRWMRVTLNWDNGASTPFYTSAYQGMDGIAQIDQAKEDIRELQHRFEVLVSVDVPSETMFISTTPTNEGS